MNVRVIGVGTRHGDDAAGLLVAEALAAQPLPPGVEVRSCELPGLALLDELEGASAAVLVDATRSGRQPGCVHRPERAALAGSGRCSSHALGVAGTLALAEALGRLPARVELVGVEGGATPSPDVGEAVRGAIAAACACVLAVVDEMRER